MAGERIPSLIMQIIDELRDRGIVIKSRPGEWRINFRNGTEATAYVTDDLQDAFAHGRAMAAEAAAVAPERKAPVCPVRRQWRRPKTAKAARRAFIRKHNRKMRRLSLRGRPDTDGSP